MSLYYLPCLIRSDRYFITRLEQTGKDTPDFNFVVSAEDRVLTPLLTIEDLDKIVLNQMAPSQQQDIPLKECHISMTQSENGYDLLIKKQRSFLLTPFNDKDSGLRMDFTSGKKGITVGIYQNRIEPAAIRVKLVLELDEGEACLSELHFNIVNAAAFNRVVIDFGSEASQIGYKNGGPQSDIVQYDILANVISRLRGTDKYKNSLRDDFLNNEPGQPMLFRSCYAVKKKITAVERKNFPFNFTDDLDGDEIRLFITKAEVAATQRQFGDDYEIIPNLKLGIEKSLQLLTDDKPEDYSIRLHKQELISGILLRLLRLMISSKPGFQKGGLIVTLLVPNIYTQHDVFGLLTTLREHTAAMLQSLGISSEEVSIEYETISESDSAFMGYQQTHPGEVDLANGDMALVIDSGKGTTDISMLLADDNENYSSFFRTGFAGAGNVLSYGFVEDFLTLVLRAVPGTNDIVIKDFISKSILRQNLTAEVLNFIQLIEDQKKNFRNRPAIGLSAFAQLSEQSVSTERVIENLHRDPSTVLVYAEAILRGRNIRWDEEVTGLIGKAADCIVHSIIAGISSVITKDIKKRIRLIMLSGRAFYFDMLRTRLEKKLAELLDTDIKIRTLPAGRVLNNKNIALYGAFSGAYKITDFTGMPVDRKEGLSKNNDVINNNMYLYRGIKIEPCNDIIYNTSVVRRNNQELKTFKNKTIDVCFTRDNIYLRLMENQRVKDVRSLYNVLAPVPENFSTTQDMKAISMFPDYAGELPSVFMMHKDLGTDETILVKKAGRKRTGVLQFFLH